MKLTEEQLREEFVAKAEKFKEDMIARFDVGRKKYNNDIDEIDYDKEIKEEELDVAIYRIMQEISQQNN